MAEGTVQRIAVIGSPGAGKSTLAMAVAAATGLPLIHLDAEHWRPGWTAPDAVEWVAQRAELVDRPAWVIDGNYALLLVQRLRRAELVIYLDLPTHRCFAGVVGRWWRWRGRVRPDMGVDCPERLDPAFLRYVLTYRRRVRPRVERDVAASGTTTVRLRTVSERDALLRRLATEGANALTA